MEIRYEDLIRDPLALLEVMYDRLDLGDFAAARPPINEYLDGMRNYETNHYELTAEQRERIRREWGDIIRRYGYE